jgi:hypothetical protein
VLLDVRLVEIDLGLRHPARCVGIDSEQPNGRFIRDAHTPEQLHDVEQREVVLPGAVVRVRRLEAERLVEAFHE